MIEIFIYVILASVAFYWIGYSNGKPNKGRIHIAGREITDINQIIHFYNGQIALIVSEPTNPNYKHWQDIQKYDIGDRYRIRGVGITSCWLEGKCGSTFPVPHQHIKLILKPFPEKQLLTPQQFKTYIQEGYDVFGIIGKFALHE